MKKLCMIALVLVLTVGLLAGCRGNNSGDTSAPSTTVMPTTTQPTGTTTQPGTDTPMPGMEDMIPGTDDTIDPSNGANQSTGDTKGQSHGMSAY
ncbi:MAG: hypothetical protein J6Q53_07475 [Oscillospiraceae bacterium]|nr:hypothetical protein [Oscillospiraceae bacterium]